jgi:hypothetical protein
MLEFLTAVNINIVVAYNVTPFSLFGVYCFVSCDISIFRVEGRIEALDFFEIFTFFYRLRRVPSQKTAIFTTTVKLPFI